VFDERALLQFDYCLLELSRVVHDNRSVPGYRLFDRLSRHKQEANPFRPGVHLLLFSPLVAWIRYNDIRFASGVQQLAELPQPLTTEMAQPGAVCLLHRLIEPRK
jgi:hypothetical protein